MWGTSLTLLEKKNEMIGDNIPKSKENEQHMHIVFDIIASIKPHNKAYVIHIISVKIILHNY